MKRIISLISALAIVISYCSCSAGYQSDREEKEAEIVNQTLEEGGYLKYTEVSIDEVNQHVESLIDYSNKSGMETEINNEIDYLLDIVDVAYESSNYANLDYFLDWNDENLEDTYERYAKNAYVVNQAVCYAFYNAYLSEEYKSIFQPYVTEDYLDYYTSLSLKKVESYAESDYEDSYELIDSYYDVAYDDSLSDDEKNLKCAEIYLDILADYDSETFYDYYNRDYSPEEILQISEVIKEELIPVYYQISELFYDYDMVEKAYRKGFAFDNPFEVVKKYTPNLSENINTYANKINDEKLYRLASGDDCYDGSFTIDLPVEGNSVIYLYMDGYFQDLFNAIHEFGHFYASFYDNTRTYSQVTNLDIAEIQSQAFELLFMQFYDDIYGEYANAMRLVETVSMLDSVISGFLVGEFEYTVLKNLDDLTPQDVVDCYYDTLGDYAEGYPLYYINHVFEYPAYYISYGVSALASFDIFDECLNDTQNALEQYEKIAKIPCSSGEYQFKSALESCGFSNVLTEDYISSLAKSLEHFAENY